jgi:hypothetical protein
MRSTILLLYLSILSPARARSENWGPMRPVRWAWAGFFRPAITEIFSSPARTRPDPKNAQVYLLHHCPPPFRKSNHLYVLKFNPVPTLFLLCVSIGSQDYATIVHCGCCSLQVSTSPVLFWLLITQQLKIFRSIRFKPVRWDHNTPFSLSFEFESWLPEVRTLPSQLCFRIHYFRRLP